VKRGMLRGRARRLAWKLHPPTLALGGGGARGFAHIGVLESIEKHGLVIRKIAGTSMGAVVGAMYAAMNSADAVRQRWEEALKKGLIPEIRGTSSRESGDNIRHPLLQRARKLKDTLIVAFAIHRESVIDDERLVKALDFLLPDLEIRDLSLPFCCTATDLENGDEVDLCGGPLRSCIKASASVPGVAPAVAVEGRRLVDGGVVAEVPVELAARMGGPVLAVDVSMDIPGPGKDDTALDTMMRTQMMTSHLLRQYQLRDARWVIRPLVGSALWSEWDRFDEMVEAGRRAMDCWLEGRDGKNSGCPPGQVERAAVSTETIEPS